MKWINIDRKKGVGRQMLTHGERDRYDLHVESGAHAERLGPSEPDIRRGLGRARKARE
jgi:hypothetical protein